MRDPERHFCRERNPRTASGRLPVWGKFISLQRQGLTCAHSQSHPLNFEHMFFVTDIIVCISCSATGFYPSLISKASKKPVSSAKDCMARCSPYLTRLNRVCLINILLKSIESILYNKTHLFMLSTLSNVS